MGNGNNEGEASKGTMGNGHRRVKLPWATAITWGTGAKALWATATTRVGILVVVQRAIHSLLNMEQLTLL